MLCDSGPYAEKISKGFVEVRRRMRRWDEAWEGVPLPRVVFVGKVSEGDKIIEWP